VGHLLGEQSRKQTSLPAVVMWVLVALPQLLV
jgi:hypothetical protein